ncbi:MAG: carbohydrate ABC transporter permease [Nocardioides sp.]
MSGTIEQTAEGERAAGSPTPERAPKSRGERVTGRDRLTIAWMVAIPTALVLWLVWVPALATVALGFFRWNGLGKIDTAQFIGLKNYDDIVHIYPPFWPAIQHNIIWLVALFAIPTVLGIFLAVLLDRELRGGSLYQTAFFLPTVLSLALIGFIWQLIYSRDQGLLNAITGGSTDWYGDPHVNLWAVIVAAGWRHTGYIMLLYLAGLKGVDPGLREAARIDGCTETQTFFRVVFPVMRPINIIVLVISVIESLRAFDLVWVINKGTNGLELISALVTSNIVGEASRIGFGSALATIMLLISSLFVVIYLRIVMREES